MKIFHRVISLLIILGFLLPVAAIKPASAQATIPFTILHTNDFHGTLVGPPPNTYTYPGAARVAQKITEIRTLKGEANVLLFDAGDMMQGSLLSNVNKGEPVIDFYRTIGYNAATFGNHEFDWGQTVLAQRIAQAEAPTAGDEKQMQMTVANITLKDAGGNCTWDTFNPDVNPYNLFTVGTPGNTVDVGVIGVGSIETPYITIAEATEGLCFRDPAEAIIHYYDGMLAAGADVIVVLSHNGIADGGYGYGFTVYGDTSLAQKLIDAGKPADLIIGGHSHTNLATATTVGPTKVVQARSSSRNLGQADFTYDPSTGNVSIVWTRHELPTTYAQDAGILALVNSYATDPDYLALVNTPVGYSQVDLMRNYNGESMMGAFVNDSIYKAHNTDADAANDMDMFFNNGGGIRIDWCDVEEPAGSGTYIWSSDVTNCAASGVWTHNPMLLNYGQMFEILPFGNATAIGEMTGAQIYDLLQQSATLFKGSLQPAGVRWKFFSYGVTAPPPANTRTTWNWGAYNIEVYDRATDTWKPLDMTKTYKVGTNEFLAPAGQDGYTPFKYMTNVTYWGDMLNAVNAYVGQTYTQDNPYKGPNGNGTLDGRITRNGDDAYTPGTGEVIPVTILHHNDSHGNLVKGAYVGYSQLVTLIKQERLLNPGRTLLVSGGDNIQGDSMMYYFKSAGLGYASDGTALAPELQINPLIKAMNLVGYDAMTLGNHEYNFGSEIFGTLGLANFPLLQANVTDDGTYGLAEVGVQPYVTKTVGPEGIRIAILGIGNHRVPSYELPSNIPGLTFTNPVDKGKELAPLLQARNDAVVALTHIGFTENPASVEVDTNIDTYFAGQVPGVDTIIGAHSHTNPASGFGAYKYNPSFVAGPNNVPVLINHAYRYNNTLGEVILGFLPDTYGGYKVVSRAGRYLSVPMATAEDAEITALAAPYVTAITAYNNTGIGQTTQPIDALQAFTQETTGGNLQADASVAKLRGEGITVDFHLSGAMTNKAVATAATPAAPISLKVSDMFTAMPYENSLVVMQMNGPQIKAVLERSFRNYWYYKYDPVNKGGYSYYTTCFLDTNFGNRITYLDDNQTTYEAKEHVLSFEVNGQRIDFTDADTYYNVSSVNYLAAGACNMSDNGHTLWPLDQIVQDTQFYVRDAVIEYITAMGTVGPTIEGRIRFTTDPLLDLLKNWLPVLLFQ